MSHDPQVWRARDYILNVPRIGPDLSNTLIQDHFGTLGRPPYLTGNTPKADIAGGHCPTPVELSALANLIFHRPGGNQFPKQFPETRHPPFSGWYLRMGFTACSAQTVTCL